ncbi:MAG: hypothetical protein V7L31_04905 [Nostoc sp.]|uniref:hypothetical protein n=1 Tax=Nostoc sp. TaxID=1180 RepID=UPI002FF0DEB2
MEIVERKDPINHYKDAINRRFYKRLIIVETTIHRVSGLNRTVLIPYYLLYMQQLFILIC